MLPSLRVTIAAVLGCLSLIITAFGLAAAVLIAQHAKIGPIEPISLLAFTQELEWEQLTSPARTVIPPENKPAAQSVIASERQPAPVATAAEKRNRGVTPQSSRVAAITPTDSSSTTEHGAATKAHAQANQLSATSKKSAQRKVRIRPAQGATPGINTNTFRTSSDNWMFSAGN